MFAIWVRQKAEDDLLQRKETLIGALWSNSNVGDPIKAVKDLERDFAEAIKYLWMTEREREAEQFALQNNKFLAGMKPIVPQISDEDDQKARMAMGFNAGDWEVDQS